ncbi:DUF5694 domain-containing protein [Sphingobacterium siyangense]|uniref:DUF5694 domain-containing protein n=1 Tax=Sphingobacterium siyangense TaxID=459529 RepID=UPI003DA587C9
MLINTIQIRNIGIAIGILFFGNSYAQQKIEVLNFGTFHMSYTPDAHKVEFDEKDQKNRKETYQVAKLLADFKPTIICVEIIPEKNEELNGDYSSFIKDKGYKAKFGGEIAIIAYEVGKLAGVKKIYGIDEQQTAAYNYNIANELENQVDSVTYKSYMGKIMQEFTHIDKLSILEKLKVFNQKETLQKFINVNADILTYSSTKGNFEGADEASKFYRRNLRIFSNLNQIPVTVDIMVILTPLLDILTPLFRISSVQLMT